MIEIDNKKCDYCGACVAVCPVDCIELEESDIKIDDKICTNCKLCVYICPIEVLSYVATESV